MDNLSEINYSNEVFKISKMSKTSMVNKMSMIQRISNMPFSVFLLLLLLLLIYVYVYSDQVTCLQELLSDPKTPISFGCIRKILILCRRP